MAYEAGYKAALASMKSDETINFRPLQDGQAFALDVKNPDVFNALASANGAQEFNNGVFIMDGYWKQAVQKLVDKGLLKAGEVEEAIGSDKAYVIFFVK